METSLALFYPIPRAWYNSRAMNSFVILFKPLTQHGAWHSLEICALNVRAMLRHKRRGIPFRKPPSNALSLFLAPANE